MGSLRLIPCVLGLLLLSLAPPGTGAVLVDTSAPSSAQPPGQAPPVATPDLASKYRAEGAQEARLAMVEKELTQTQDRLEKLNETSETIERYLAVMGSVLSVFIIGLIFSINRIIKTRFAKALEAGQKSLEDQHKLEKAKLEEALAVRNSEAMSRLEVTHNAALREIEENLYKHSQITALRFAHQYDEALAFAGWSGDFKAFEEFPHAIQRHLISCLANSPKARADSAIDTAWAWAQALVDASPTVENVLTMLRTANAVRHYDDAIALFDRVAGNLTPEGCAVCEPFLIVVLRKSPDFENGGRWKDRLLALSNKHRESRDIRTKTTLAAVFRDRGKFEDAEMIMNPFVKKRTGFSIAEAGWDKLFNTYIANCIDLGRPADAVSQVKTILAHFSRPDHVFNCARVAWRLPPDNEARREIVRLIARRFDDGLMPEKDDGTIKALAILREMEGRPEEAEDLLRKSIEEMSNHSSRWARDQKYFFHCALAELLLSRDDAKSVDMAIDLLESVCHQDTNGEANYHIARAWLSKRNTRLVESHLVAAADRRRKWIIKAKYDPAFTTYRELDELISRYV